MEAFRLLVEMHQARVIGTISKMLGSDAESEDLAQQVFIRIWKSAPRYQPTAKFTTWLFRITRNLVFNELRRKRHFADQSEEIAEPTERAEREPDQVLLEGRTSACDSGGNQPIPGIAANGNHPATVRGNALRRNRESHGNNRPGREEHPLPSKSGTQRASGEVSGVAGRSPFTFTVHRRSFRVWSGGSMPKRPAGENGERRTPNGERGRPSEFRSSRKRARDTRKDPKATLTPRTNDLPQVSAALPQSQAPNRPSIIGRNASGQESGANPGQDVT